MEKRSTSIQVHLLEHQATGNDWVAIKARRRGGRPGDWVFMKAEDFHDKRKLSALIKKKSLIVGDLTLDAIMNLLPNKVGLLREQPGWLESSQSKRFVLFDHILVDNKGQCVFYARPAEARGLSVCSGNLNDWITGVAHPALKSYPATIGLLTSFAAPLLPLSQVSEGAVINLVAPSSSGKSSINKAAYSVWGDPGFLPSWSGTEAAITQTASAHNHLVCPLDDGELANLDPKNRSKKLNSFAHVLADGTPKQYSKTVKDEHESLPFKSFILSSNPVSIETAMTGPHSRTDGDRVRFLEISAPSGEEGGIWAVGPLRYVKKRGNKQKCATRSKQLVSAAEKNHGFAGKAYLSWLEENFSDLEDRISKQSSKFLDRHFPGLGGTKLRIAEKFALMYAAGIFAIEAGLFYEENSRSQRTLHMNIANACKFAINEAFKMAYQHELNYYEAADAIEDWLESSGEILEFLSRKDPKLTGSKIKCGFYVRDEDAFYIRLSAFEDFLRQRFGTERISKHSLEQLLQHFSAQGFFRKPARGRATADVRIGAGNEKIKLMKFSCAKN